MPKLEARLRFFGHLMAVFPLLVMLLPGACFARHRDQDCGPSFCGNLNISYPFRLKTQPLHCGVNGYELECENNNRTTLVLREAKFSVQNISYGSVFVRPGTLVLNLPVMRVVDASLDTHDCHSLPFSPVYFQYFRSGQNYNYKYYYHKYYYDSQLDSGVIYVLNCTKHIKSSLYIDAFRCSTKSNTSSYLYFIHNRTPPSDFDPSCTIEAELPIMVYNLSGMSTLDIYNKLSEGFLLSWDLCDYEICEVYDEPFKKILSSLGFAFRNYLDSFIWFPLNSQSVYDNPDSYIPARTYILCLGITVGVITLRTSVGIICLLVLVINKWKRRHLSADSQIEDFLQNHNLAPIRYSFKELKKMSQNFKDKLGEGGYGSVFKGKLRSGHYVAVKLLGKSKGNGEDFMNEVASIGRIHHTNVAKLVGFCVEGSKQALVYDFMSNGSLDKIIFTEENKNSLGWTKMFDIVLGVARGIDYLHQGCDMQILHFDIKPHNILLDDNFTPKVSDFGLAKLYSVDDSIVALTAARGTIGYIAPELVYKNLGGISYKADVYSFGMLLMEMIGRRKNLNEIAEHRSQIYFPSWIYERLNQGEDIELGDVSDAEKVIVRKMVITAFWCIQLLPTDRPSMNKVLTMLETDIQLLEMPPNPFYQLHLDTSVEMSTSLDVVTITSSNVV